MSRDDLFWVVVRSFGIVVLFLGVHGLLGAFLYAVRQPLETPVVMTHLFSVGVGAYTLFGGSWLFNAASRARSGDDPGSAPERP